ncbi:Serine/threonine-protein kinase PknB [Aquisphaera giovannonii]|uniref:Serine/threonine-protein kinase PknB n=1 Tax=Aquisphaera giovannonii TaxID=406548 RepID=A0A5B9VU94_9BACT|nr:protein kinase [Aquisphaera giovannonii]QEH31644.1 Serine/threonine-protein kinase PknB [Aquisphaera giovannonii]
MTPTEPVTPIDEALLAALMAEEAALAEGGTPPDDPDGSRRGLRDCLRLLRTLAPDTPPEAGQGEPTRFGRFTILGELGRGGFGIVYRAFDPLLDRHVALKVPRPELIASSEVRRRFLREARAAAGLDHPNIVPVLDAGPMGPFCFIALALCPGPTLAQWLRGQTEPVPPQAAARLVADLAGAVQHAHERGVLHRDIKPSNVILGAGESDAAGRPRLTDFGLARLAEEGGSETRTFAVLGSPPYMAPEQAAGRNADVGPATDVHALGAILYEVLVGRPPFVGEGRSETIRQVIEAEPIPPRTLRPRLPRDLETIVLTCLAKAPARRYGSAAALRDDLGRSLRGEPIRARPPRWTRTAASRVRRHPTLFASALLMILAAAGLFGVLAWSNARQRRTIGELTAARSRADAQARETDRHRDLADRYFHGSQLQLAGKALDAGEFEHAQDVLHELACIPVAPARRDFARDFLWGRACRDVAPLFGHDRDVNAMEITPDGRTLVTGDVGGTIRLWDLAGEGPHVELGRHTEPVSYLAIAASGRWLASTAGRPGRPGHEVILWDLANRRPADRPPIASGTRVVSLGFEAGDEALWIETNPPPPLSGGEVLRFDLRTAMDEPRGSSHWPPPGQVRVLRDGRVVVITPDPNAADDRWSGGDAGSACARWDSLGLPGNQVRFAATPDSRLVAAAHPGWAVICRDSRTGARVARLEMPETTAFEMAFSPDGRSLAAGCDPGAVILWDLATGRHVRLRLGDPHRTGPVLSLAFSPDGSKLAVSEWAVPGGATPVTVWEVATGRRIAEYPGRRDRATRLLFAADGRSLLIASGPTLRRWRLDREAEPPSPSGHLDEAWALAFRPDGGVLATGGDDTDEPSTVKLWDPATGRLVRQWSGGPGTVASLAFSPDGRILASGHLERAGNVRLWDPGTGRLIATLSGHNDRVRSVAFHPDGRHLASAGSDRTIRIWDVATRRRVCELAGHSMTVQGLAFSPDGRRLASAGADATVRLWDAAAWRPLRTLQGPAKFTAVAFAPDGGAIAGADESGTVLLWAPETGERLGVIHGEDGALRTLAFAPDGRALAASGEGGTIKVWDPVTRQRLLILPGRSLLVHATAFSPDGRILAASDEGGAVRLWRAP